MEVQFANNELRQRFIELRVGTRAWGDVIARAYIRRVNFLQSVASISDLRQAQSLRMHALQGPLAGMFALTLHDRWRRIVRIESDKITIQEVTNHYDD